VLTFSAFMRHTCVNKAVKGTKTKPVEEQSEAEARKIDETYRKFTGPVPGRKKKTKS
jgi:hypothetical protein